MKSCPNPSCAMRGQTVNTDRTTCVSCGHPLEILSESPDDLTINRGATMNDQQMTELQETGRTYVPINFGDDLGRTIASILDGVDTLGIPDVKITLAGSASLLVQVPEDTTRPEDPDQEEG